MRTRSNLFLTLAVLATPLALGACGGGSSTTGRVPGQSTFVSAPPPGTAGAAVGGANFGASNAPSPSSPSGQGATSTPQRTVQETDLYRLEGTRLYYLNSYRGLMVFDVTNVDQPKLLGRSAIFGSPVQMVVNQGIAVVIVADWYGTLDNGAPFHGSIVRGLDASDPTNIKVLGEAKLGGWVQDTRVVGNVLYAVSEDYGWQYGWVGFGPVGAGVGVAPGAGGGASSPDVIVSSVSFANGTIQQVASKTYAGYGGVFNVTPNAIMLAHPAAGQPNQVPPAKTDLQYLDITDPGGNIVERGALEVDGSIQGWGADNGRWNLDFADGKTAHVVGCAGSDYGCGGSNGSYVLATADFSNPDQPKLASELTIPSTGWDITARFDSSRMYLSPAGGYSSNASTPLEIFDLSNPAAPALAGQTQIPGTVWIMIPSGNQLFALGQDNNGNSSQVSLKYLDVTNAAAPTLIGASQFGDGWAWTPAADTFKAFTMSAPQGLVVLPFSGWDASNEQYNNGVQLIEFTPSSIATAGAAHTQGWVERGIFVNNRIVSLSDLALSVVDYTNPVSPQVTAELTLARNVIAAQPSAATIAQVSSDWWGNDNTHSDVRVLPISDAAENFDQSQAPDVSVDGVDARVFNNGSLSYLVTSLQVPAPCGNGSWGVPGGPNGTCYTWQEQVQVVDLSNGGAKLRGKVALPIDPGGWYWYWGWYGCFWYDWYDGAEIVQVGSDALAFRRWHPNFNSQGQYVDASSDLFIVDLSNADAPTLASTVITTDPTGWWGNMKMVGSTLYTGHYVWSDHNGQTPTVRYYVDPIDLSDRSHPKVQARINTPGMLVGGSATDASILYTIDYRWTGNQAINEFDAVKIDNGVAYLQSVTALDGWVGNIFVRGNTAYASAQQYNNDDNGSNAHVELHQIDLSNATQPVDRVASGPQGWGWLLDVQGDRLLVTSGWGPDGLDIYRTTPNAPPAYDQFVRTRGWWINSVARQDNQLFLSSGYWGVEPVVLQ
jgi:hypothetical protein